MGPIELLAFSLLILSVKGADISVKIVNITQGPVKGHISTDGKYYQFFGIPYATVPSGTEKFKAPLPPPNWTEPFDAVNRNVVCFQGAALSDSGMSADCLVANVYVPKTNKTKLPVMVDFHGGAFQIGSGSYVNPGALVDQGHLIFVSFNYRLGVHGFLCLGTENVPGNAGLKDQLALLRWVKRNIASFGGDPNDITIEGCSAGSASVELMTLAPIAEGYFKRAIMQSGSGISGWSIQQDPIYNARKLAAELGFESSDINELDKFLTSQTFEKLYSGKYFVNREDAGLGWVPCVENDIDEEPFLREAPLELLRKQKKSIPMYMTFANKEGLFKLDSFNGWKDAIKNNFSDFLPSDIRIEDEEERNLVLNKLRKTYFDDQPVEEETIDKFIMYVTDMMFANGLFRSAEKRIDAAKPNVYLFEFKYVEQPNAKNAAHPFLVNGATHCAETHVILGDYRRNETDTSKEFKEFQKFMRQKYINFMKHNNPTNRSDSEKWSKWMLDITPHNEAFVTEIKPRLDLWDEVYQKFYYPPNSP